jgi:glycosyltransferase involved in cell wall biosynthesis
MGWQRDLVAVYRDLEAVCLTSWNEGTPVSMIEAMAAGRPVIATDVGGVRDVLGRCGATSPIGLGEYRVTERGILVRPGDPDGLAAACQALAADPALRLTLGQAAREHVVRYYAQAKLLEGVAALYLDLNAGRSTR